MAGGTPPFVLISVGEEELLCVKHNKRKEMLVNLLAY